jgi:hypothetical protein
MSKAEFNEGTEAGERFNRVMSKVLRVTPAQLKQSAQSSKRPKQLPKADAKRVR